MRLCACDTPMHEPHGARAVTAAVFESIRAGFAASCVMARSCGASVHAIDVGINTPEVPPHAATTRVSSGMLAGFLPGGEYGTDDEASSGLFANPTPDTARLGESQTLLPTFMRMASMHVTAHGL